MILKLKDFILIAVISANLYFSYVQREEQTALIKKLIVNVQKNSELIEKSTSSLNIEESFITQPYVSQADSWFLPFQAVLPFIVGTIIIFGLTYYMCDNDYPLGEIFGVTYYICANGYSLSDFLSKIGFDILFRDININSVNPVILEKSIITKTKIADKIKEDNLIGFKPVSDAPFEGCIPEVLSDTNIVDKNLQDFLYSLSE